MWSGKKYHHSSDAYQESEEDCVVALSVYPKQEEFQRNKISLFECLYVLTPFYEDIISNVTLLSFDDPRASYKTY